MPLADLLVLNLQAELADKVAVGFQEGEKRSHNYATIELGVFTLLPGERLTDILREQVNRKSAVFLRSCHPSPRFDYRDPDFLMTGYRCQSPLFSRSCLRDPTGGRLKTPPHELPLRFLDHMFPET